MLIRKKTKETTENTGAKTAAEKKTPSIMARDRKRKIIRGALLAFGVLVIAAVIYIGAVMLESPDRLAEDGLLEEYDPVTPLQAGQTTTPETLAKMFGGMLPAIRNASMNGVTENMVYEGMTVRRADQYYSGVTVTAVSPADASPLLNYGALSVDAGTENLLCLGCKAMLAQKGDARCVYFTKGNTAYAVYAPQASKDDFFALLERLYEVNP